MQFDYFYEIQAESYSFYRIPRILFTEEIFEKLSTEAKVLYGFLLDRISLSREHGWMDEAGRVFVYCTIKKVKRSLRCANSKACGLLKELEDFGLIERKKQGQGKPAVIYVKDFTRFRKSESLNSEDRNLRVPENGIQDFHKSEPNKTKKNNTEFSETDPSNPPTPTERSRRTRRSDWWKARMDEIDRCKREVRFQIGYDRLAQTHPYDMGQVDDYVELIVDVLTSRKDYLYVSRENRPIAQVQGQFEKLTYEHIDYILDSMRNCATNVTNIRAYMLSTLFNAPNTIRAYYDAKVRHDMAQDDWWDNMPRKQESWAS